MAGVCNREPRCLEGLVVVSLKVVLLLSEFCTPLVYTLQNVAVSSGSGEEDLEKLRKIVDSVPNIKYICLDVANGYSEHFVSFVRQARKDFPAHTIMVRLYVTLFYLW